MKNKEGMKRKEELAFYWVAEFSDGSKIEQFDKNGKEVLYKEVDDRYDDLVMFSITDGTETYSVDLDKWKLITPNKTYTSKDSNRKLLYFRRNHVRMSLGEKREILSPRVYHHLGIKSDGKDLKVIVFAGKEQKPKNVEIVK